MMLLSFRCASVVDSERGVPVPYCFRCCDLLLLLLSTEAASAATQKHTWQSGSFISFFSQYVFHPFQLAPIPFFALVKTKISQKD